MKPTDPRDGDVWEHVDDEYRVTVKGPWNGNLVEFRDHLRPSGACVRGLHYEDFMAQFSLVFRRPPVDDYFMNLAHAVSLRGTCDRRLVGAVAVRDGRLLATGFNGSAKGVPHCVEVGHDLIETNGRWSCSRAIHAECNLLSYAARFGVSIENSTVYTNTYPCHGCMKAMVSAGIARVVYDADYFNEAVVERLATDAGVTLVRFQPEE